MKFIFVKTPIVPMSRIHKIRVIQAMFPNESREVFLSDTPKHLEEHLDRLESSLCITPSFYAHPETIRVYDSLTAPVSIQ